jgi:hypothetical protein
MENEMAGQRWWGALGLAAAATVALAAHADQATVIDLTYDSTMDMVRPEYRPGIEVHHHLHVTVSGAGILSERRNRNTKLDADRNASAQILDDSGDNPTYVTWHTEADGRLVRVQQDPQSTRTMTVTLLPGNTCRLDVVDRLKPGFTEYEFLRIRTHTMGFYSTYAVVATSCRIR